MDLGVAKQHQLDRAVEWWNDRVDTIIQPDIDSSEDRADATFKWSQLVWQEVVMFIQIGEASNEDVDLLTHRRGFSKLQDKFLRDILRHVGFKIAASAEDVAAQEVIDKYHEAIDNRSHATFAWPDDALCGYRWQYFVHVAWVDAWNKENRETECIEFLTNWLTKENVSKALDDYRDFEGILIGG